MREDLNALRAELDNRELLMNLSEAVARIQARVWRFPGRVAAIPKAGRFEVLPIGDWQRVPEDGTVRPISNTGHATFEIWRGPDQEAFTSGVDMGSCASWVVSRGDFVRFSEMTDEGEFLLQFYGSDGS
jgi:hypothetical protein